MGGAGKAPLAASWLPQASGKRAGDRASELALCGFARRQLARRAGRRETQTQTIIESLSRESRQLARDDVHFETLDLAHLQRAALWANASERASARTSGLAQAFVCATRAANDRPRRPRPSKAAQKY